MNREDYLNEYNLLDPGAIDSPQELPVNTPVQRPALVEQPSTRRSPDVIEGLPSGEITNTVLLGAFLAIIGNNLLKPLFALIIRNFESDQKATGDVVNLLKDRISKLEADNSKAWEDNQRQAEEHSKYLRSLDTANAQAANIATILQNQTTHIEAMADSIRQLSLEVADHRLDVQRQIDSLSQHIRGMTIVEPLPTPYPKLRNKGVKN